MDKQFIEECKKYGNVIPKALEFMNNDNSLKIGLAIDKSIKELGLNSPNRRIHDALITVIGKALFTGRFEGFPDA